MRKGQAEMIGLVVIILLLFGALILFFSLRSEEEPVVVQVRSSIRANQVRNAILNVNLPDHENKVLKDVLYENCFGIGADVEGDDCRAIKTLIEYILRDNIGLREEYYFKAFIDDSTFIEIESPCTDNKIVASPAAYRIEGSIVNVDFELCLGNL